MSDWDGVSWIPVAERHPPEGKEVLIFMRHLDRMSGTPSCIGCDGKGGIMSLDTWEVTEGEGHWQMWDGEDITHWQPLPLPPEER